MGMDPDARLAYGYRLGDSDKFDLAEATGEFGELVVDWYDDDRKDNFETQLWARLYDLTPEPRPAVEYDWQKEDAARSHWNVDIVHSGSHDYPGYILTVTGDNTEGSYRSVEWSDSMELDLHAMVSGPEQMTWDARLAAALKALGLTPTQAGPKWLVFPFYG